MGNSSFIWHFMGCIVHLLNCPAVKLQALLLQHEDAEGHDFLNCTGRVSLRCIRWAVWYIPFSYSSLGGQLDAQISSQFSSGVLKVTKHTFNVDYPGDLSGFIQKKSRKLRSNTHKDILHTYMQIKLMIILPTCDIYFVPLLEMKFFKVLGNYTPQRNRHKLLNSNPWK